MPAKDEIERVESRLDREVDALDVEIKSAQALLRSLTSSTASELSDLRTGVTELATWKKEHVTVDGAAHGRIEDHELRLRDLQEIAGRVALMTDLRAVQDALTKAAGDAAVLKTAVALEKDVRERYVSVDAHKAALDELAATKKIAVANAARWTRAKWTLYGLALALGAGGHELSLALHAAFGK